MRNTILLILGIIAMSCAKQGIAARTCVKLQHASLQSTLPDYLVVAPGVESGRAGVAASEEKAPSPGSAYAAPVTWHRRGDTISLAFDGKNVTTTYRLAGLPDSARGLAVTSIHLAYGDSSEAAVFAHTESTRVTGLPVACDKLARGLPQGF
jgi:hypothetical protein